MKWYYLWPSVLWGRLAQAREERMSSGGITGIGYWDEVLDDTAPFSWLVDNWGGLCFN